LNETREIIVYAEYVNLLGENFNGMKKKREVVIFAKGMI
jgi:hypothetical protein